MHSDYTSRKQSSQDNRAISESALGALEDALAAPSPNRTIAWHQKVVEALDTFLAALHEQALADQDPDSLLPEIARQEPRFAPRIQRLKVEQDDIEASAASLRSQIGTDTDHTHIDVADIRDRLASITNRYRQHRAREADLVYEAVNVDLGIGD